MGPPPVPPGGARGVQHEGTRVRARLVELIVAESVLYRPEEPFRLSSGRQSPVYIDLRTSTHRPEAMRLIGAIVVPLLPEGVTAVGGLTMGADSVAAAVAATSPPERPVAWFSVRKDPKEHGAARWIEGPVKRGDQVAVVEDVLTTGKSLRTALERVVDAGLQVRAVIALVDREEGGREAVLAFLAERGIEAPLHCVFRKAELVEAWEAKSTAGSRPR